MSVDLSPHIQKRICEMAKNVTPSLPASTDDPLLLYSLAYLFYEKGEYSKAEPLFQKLIQIQPLQPAYWRALASLWQQCSKWSDALVCWGILLLMIPTDGMAHFHAAECLLSLDRLEEAKEALLRAKEHFTPIQKEELLGRVEILYEQCRTNEN